MELLPVLDANVINQAGPETAGFKTFSSADMQTIAASQTSLCVSGNFHIINIQYSVRPISHKTSRGQLPSVIRNCDCNGSTGQTATRRAVELKFFGIHRK